MDNIKKLSNKANIKINEFLKIFVPLVLFLVILLVISSYIRALIYYEGTFLWWKIYNGKNYPNNIDLTSYAVFNYSKLAFDIQQKLTSGPKQTNETSIMLMQAIVFNKQKKIAKGDISSPFNFTTPYHVCKSISWGPDEGQELCSAVKETYSDYNSGSTPTVSITINVPGVINPLGDVTAWYTNKSNVINNGTPGNDKNWISDTIQPIGGFWPHQNGCSGFFDLPLGATATDRYNLFDNIPIPRIKLSSGGYNRPPLYYPGAPNAQGSWAQLFADWGIVYTINSQSGKSSVPVISDGANCGDGNTYINPCPSTGMGWCNLPNQKDPSTCTQGVNNYFYPPNNPVSTNLPNSDYTVWYDSGKSNGGSSIGLNFIATYQIHPASYIITSWVGDLYDDPTTGIIFDAQAFRNLVGYQGPNQVIGYGGWNLFLKGINTNLTSYDNVMNELFRQYATNFSARDTVSKDSCSTGKKLKSAGTDAMTGLMAGAMIGSAVPVVGTAIGAALGFIGGALIGAFTAC